MQCKSIISTFVMSVLLSAGANAAENAALPTGPSSASPLQLDSLVKEAKERNPEIQVARQSALGKRARIPQARAWPDPRLSVSYGGNVLPPFTLMGGDPSSTRQIMAEQEIPFPGKTRLRGEVAAREADSEGLAAEAVERRVIAAVKQAYLELYFTDQSLAILRKYRTVLEQLAKVAAIRYSVGKAAQQDVLRAQLELSRLTERQTLLEQSRQTLVAQLNSLRDQPVDATLGSPGAVEPSVLILSFDDLLAAAQSNNPDLNRQRSLIAANQASVNLARKEVRPDFTVGYAYMQRAGLPDMYGLTFSTSLPIFRRKKQDQAIAESAANLAAARRSEANELALLRYRLREDFLQVQSAEQLMNLYTKGLTPQARLTLESSLASYEVGAVDLLTVLTNFTTLFDYELNYQQQLTMHGKALARLEELSGLTLMR